MNILKDNTYRIWIEEIKSKIRSSQIKAAIAINKELILFYWELGEMINQKLSISNWGDKVLQNVSNDLKEDFSSIGGLSERNLKYCKCFYQFYSDEIRQQAVAQIEKSTNS